jgi:hypothetical protein
MRRCLGSGCLGLARGGRLGVLGGRPLQPTLLLGLVLAPQLGELGVEGVAMPLRGAGPPAPLRPLAVARPTTALTCPRGLCRRPGRRRLSARGRSGLATRLPALLRNAGCRFASRLRSGGRLGGRGWAGRFRGSALGGRGWGARFRGRRWQVGRFRGSGLGGRGWGGRFRGSGLGRRLVRRRGLGGGDRRLRLGGGRGRLLVTAPLGARRRFPRGLDGRSLGLFGWVLWMLAHGFARAARARWRLGEQGRPA